MFAIGAEYPFTETAQKFARRHMIGGKTASAFRIITEKIDDEIPF